MALVRPRLNDYYDLPFTQEQAEFGVPFLDEDIPLYADPFLLWKSPSMQDNSLHTALVASFNYLGELGNNGDRERAIDSLIRISECSEVGLGSAANKQGRRIGRDTAIDILEVLRQLRSAQRNLGHVEVVQLYVDQISKDRVSDITCSLLKSFLIDFTQDQCSLWGIPTEKVAIEVFNYQDKRFNSESLNLPANPQTHQPLLLVPKRWLRFTPWINYDDFFQNAFVPQNKDRLNEGRIGVLHFNRNNYGLVETYVQAKERTSADCKNDPLFKPIAVISAKSKLRQIRRLPTGKADNADREYEDEAAQLMASLMYPHLDFADEQSRIDSGTQIRDLIFYNNRSMDFLEDVHRLYGCRQLVVELKNEAAIEREHVNQLNRYLSDQFGAFGVLLTRNPESPLAFRTVREYRGGDYNDRFRSQTARLFRAYLDRETKRLETIFPDALCAALSAIGAAGILRRLNRSARASRGPPSTRSPCRRSPGCPRVRNTRYRRPTDRHHRGHPSWTTSSPSC